VSKILLTFYFSLFTVFLQAGLLALPTFTSLPIQIRTVALLPVKAFIPANRNQDYSGGTAPDLNGIPY
jgi:hypothetical protein